jgi:hypothetical protein
MKYPTTSGDSAVLEVAHWPKNTRRTKLTIERQLDGLSSRLGNQLRAWLVSRRSPHPVSTQEGPDITIDVKSPHHRLVEVALSAPGICSGKVIFYCLVDGPSRVAVHLGLHGQLGEWLQSGAEPLPEALAVLIPGVMRAILLAARPAPVKLPRLRQQNKLCTSSYELKRLADLGKGGHIPHNWVVDFRDFDKLTVHLQRLAMEAIKKLEVLRTSATRFATLNTGMNPDVTALSPCHGVNGMHVNVDTLATLSSQDFFITAHLKRHLHGVDEIRVRGGTDLLTQPLFVIITRDGEEVVEFCHRPLPTPKADKFNYHWTTRDIKTTHAPLCRQLHLVFLSLLRHTPSFNAVVIQTEQLRYFYPEYPTMASATTLLTPDMIDAICDSAR